MARMLSSLRMLRLNTMRLVRRIRAYASPYTSVAMWTRHAVHRCCAI
jgi:hypothetical protein